MNWMDAAYELFPLANWNLAILAALYAVPIFRLISQPIEYSGRFLMRINKFFGAWEHLVCPIRDTLVALYVLCGTVWYVFLGVMWNDAECFIAAAAGAALIAIGFFNRILKRNARKKLIIFANKYPLIHPQEFFNYFLCSGGAMRHRLPKAPFFQIDPVNVDFSKGGRGFVKLPGVLLALWSIFWISRLVMIAWQWRGKQFMQEVAASVSVILSTRISQLAKFSVRIEGVENLPDANLPQIYVFNHMSFLDFMLAPLVLAAGKQNGFPCFLLAKDHFRDNWFLYRVLGIGRIAELLGMVFVDRRATGKIASAKAVASTAAEIVLNTINPLVIYPQGSRSYKCISPNGERLDSAYYTVGSKSRIKADGKHLKKGAARIAALAAEKLASSGSNDCVRVVPVVFSGTGIACPRKKWRVMSNMRISLKVGGEIRIHALYASQIDLIHSRIDLSLKNGARVHAELERRFFEDIRKFADAMKIDEIAVAMKAWRGDDYLVHAILDAIYACNAKMWRPLLGELMHLLTNFASREELLLFKGKVADALS